MGGALARGGALSDNLGQLLTNSWTIGIKVCGICVTGGLIEKFCEAREFCCGPQLLNWEL